MLRLRFLIGLLFLSILPVFAQQEKDSVQEENLFKEKIHFGGGLQLSIGNGYTTVGVSPSAVYEFSDKWAGGVSASYIYIHDKYYDFDYSIFGGSTLLLYNPIKELQLNTELEYLRVNRIRNAVKENYWVPAWYVGVGYTINKLGAIGVRYDLLWQEDKSIYRDALTPYVRIYF